MPLKRRYGLPPWQGQELIKYGCHSPMTFESISAVLDRLRGRRTRTLSGGAHALPLQGAVLDLATVGSRRKSK